MDLDDFRLILKNSGVDVWTMIETAILVAWTDCGKELKERRDRIVERLYASPVAHQCRNCDLDATEIRDENKCRSPIEKESSTRGGGCEKGASPSMTPPLRSINVEDDEDRESRALDREKRKILAIKEHLEDPDKPDDSLVELLRNLADMEITFTALKETDIGRHVNGLRKHPSSEVRRYVKHLVRKWKDLVDEWVKLHGETSTTAVIDGDSPNQFPAKSIQIDNQVPEIGYSSNCQNGSSGSNKYNPPVAEMESKTISRQEPPQNRQDQPTPDLSNKQKKLKESLIDPERLASARRRLHENYQEAQNAKKQRTIQVMDLQDIPKPKNAFFARNKGSYQNKHW